jgi:hypothetical protein
VKDMIQNSTIKPLKLIKAGENKCIQKAIILLAPES